MTINPAYLGSVGATDGTAGACATVTAGMMAEATGTPCCMVPGNSMSVSTSQLD